MSAAGTTYLYTGVEGTGYLFIGAVSTIYLCCIQCIAAAVTMYLHIYIGAVSTILLK